MSKLYSILPLAFALSACAASPSGPGSAPVTVAPTVKFHKPPTMGNRKLPFSEAVQVGNLLFLAGKVGRKPGERSVVPGGIQPETRQVLKNIKDVLVRHGSSMDKVVKCTVFLADIGEWSKMNEIYMQFFPENPPARSALGASGLALNARVEIECIAVL